MPIMERTVAEAEVKAKTTSHMRCSTSDSSCVHATCMSTPPLRTNGMHACTGATASEHASAHGRAKSESGKGGEAPLQAEGYRVVRVCGKHRFGVPLLRATVRVRTHIRALHRGYGARGCGVPIRVVARVRVVCG